MRTRILKVFIIATLGVIAFVLGAKWFLKQAFGPLKRTVKIELPDNQSLLCEETYNADLAGIFYDVDFKLFSNGRALPLGRTQFTSEHWDEELKLFTVGDWNVLPVQYQSYLRLLLVNQKTLSNTDTTLSPHDLRADKLWKKDNKQILAWVYTGSSKLEQINENRFSVEFNYRVGDYQPFKFYKQRVDYELDSMSGKLLTRFVNDKIEIRK